ncbi:MAG: topoisomerase C-terminal repeat-containing protein, partial [Parafilimonas sp.]
KPRFAKLKSTQSIETINLEEGLELFKLPRNLGKFEDEDVLVNIGRFGPYASHSKMFYSLNKNMDPYSITLEAIIPLIEEKRKAKDERTIKVFEKEKIQILNGPYGAYIKQGLRNYKLTKEQQKNAANLSIDEVNKIIEYTKANPPKKIFRKKNK